MDELPKSVNVMGVKYKIKFMVMHGTLGLCNQQTRTIYINPDQDSKTMWHTFLHELGHAWTERAGISQAVGGELLEVISETLATVLMENFDFS